MLQINTVEKADFLEDNCEETLEQERSNCASRYIVKNGSIHNDKQKYKSKSCGHQFIDNPTKVTISVETKQFIDRLLLEKISLRGIARVTQVSWSWLQDYINLKLARILRRIKVSGKSKGRLSIECNEMWPFFITRIMRFVSDWR